MACDRGGVTAKGIFWSFSIGYWGFNGRASARVLAEQKAAIFTKN
jgi:hypothetical protein